MGELMDLTQAITFRQQLRAANQKLVFTNGLFDLIHVGHLDYLERARALGDALMVGLNSDASALTLKGQGHPIIPQDERGRLLAALSVVDAVVIFDGLTATHLITTLQPEIYVKGGDYAHKEWPEKQAALASGCRVELIPFLKGRSTSELIAKIVALHSHYDN